MKQKTQQYTTNKEIELKAFAYWNKKRNEIHISTKQEGAWGIG